MANIFKISAGILRDMHGASVNTGVLSVTAGTGITVGGTAQDPVISNSGVLSVTAGSGISVGGTAQNPIVGVDSTDLPTLISETYSETSGNIGDWATGTLVPAGCTRIQYELKGAGGGGGGSTLLLVAGSNSVGGGGGGAGWYASGEVIVTPTTRYAGSVGQGGAGGTPAADSGNPGDKGIPTKLYLWDPSGTLDLIVWADGGYGGIGGDDGSLTAGGGGGWGYHGGGGGGRVDVVSAAPGGRGLAGNETAAHSFQIVEFDSGDQRISDEFPGSGSPGDTGTAPQKANGGAGGPFAPPDPLEFKGGAGGVPAGGSAIGGGGGGGGRGGGAGASTSGGNGAAATSPGAGGGGAAGIALGSTGAGGTGGAGADGFIRIRFLSA